YLQRLSLRAHDGGTRRRAHAAPADRHGRLARRLLPPPPSRRGGRAPRRPLRRPRELGRGTGLRPHRVPGLRGPTGGERRPFPGGRRGRPPRLDRRSADLRWNLLPVQRHRGAAEAAPEAPSARVARPRVAAASPEATRRAGTAGFTIMMDPHSTHREIAGKRELYRTALEAAGHSMAGREVPMARLLAIAPTRSAAEETARRGARWLVESYAGPQHQSLTGVIGFGVAGGPGTPPAGPAPRDLARV